MITRAPRSDSLLITGRLARIRPSSVISPVPVRSSGTFRSDRSSTRRPDDLQVVDGPHYRQPWRATSAVRSTSRLE